MELNTIIVSFSGGRTSAYMAKRMKEDPRWNRHKLVFVFANTGKEREETLVFVDQCDKEFGLNVIWVEAVVNPEDRKGTTHKIVSFDTASRNGEPFEAVIQKYGIPNKPFPHCTRELKFRPITSYAKSTCKDYVTAIGIRIDEPRRVKVRDGVVYPLLDWFTTVRDIRDFWNKQAFDLKLKDYEGNCGLCWKKSIRKKLTLIREDSRIADWWISMEEKYSLMDKHGEKTPPFYFHRDNTPTVDLVEMAKGKFIPATDPYWRSDLSREMDDEQACSCMSSEELFV